MMRFHTVSEIQTQKSALQDSPVSCNASSSFRNAGRILEGVQVRQEDGDLPEVPDRAPQHCHSEVTLLSQVYLGQTALVRQDDP